MHRRSSVPPRGCYDRTCRLSRFVVSRACHAAYMGGFLLFSLEVKMNRLRHLFLLSSFHSKLQMVNGAARRTLPQQTALLGEWNVLYETLDGKRKMRNNLGAQSKSEKCEIAETQLPLRARLQPAEALDIAHVPTQMAFRTCKEAMSDIWRWPALKRKMAIRSRQRTTTSTPNIISDRCSPKRHNKRRPTQVAIDQADPRTSGRRPGLCSPLGNRSGLDSRGDSPLRAPASRASAASTQLTEALFLAAGKEL